LGQLKAKLKQFAAEDHIAKGVELRDEIEEI
jgi:hypothetical protein